MSDFLDQINQSQLVQFLGPKWVEWVEFATLALFLPSLFLLLRRRMTHWGARQKQQTQLSMLIAELSKRVMRWFLIITGVWLASKSLSIDPRLEKVINRLFVVTTFVQTAILAIWALDWSVERLLATGTASPTGQPGDDNSSSSKVSQSIFRFLIRIIVVTALILSLLDNMGVEIKTLVAGLGVGGIAVALAVQNILGDLLASLSIALDRPFEVGDVITPSTDVIGTVEKIGVKTTRIRALTGEQIICNNSDLLKNHIRNFKNMSERRIIFKFGIEYETPVEKIRKIPEMIKEIMAQLKDVRLDRAHFASFGESSLDFEVAWFALSGEYVHYMNAQQEINLALLERFAAETINFAYPLQRVQVVEQSTMLSTK